MKNWFIGIVGAGIILLAMLIPLTSSMERMVRKSAANEPAAIAQLQAIVAAQTRYRNAHGGNYARSLEELGTRPAAGYTFLYIVSFNGKSGKAERYQVLVEPRTARRARHFYVDETGVVRWEQGRPAGRQSDPLLAR